MTASAAPLSMSPADRLVLERIAKSTAAAHREVLRARVLLDAADGVANTVIGARHQVTAVTVRAWRKAFASDGLTGWGVVKAGRGRKPSIPAETIARIVELTTSKDATPDGHTHWSCRTMAAEVGVSAATVQRIWAAHGLQPHRVRTFKLSRDPAFVSKLRDVVGLYLNPPAHAVVLSVDEKSQIQALDRTQPGLPMKKGRAGTMTHDYKRNGTTMLFAALNVLDGSVIGQCMQRHRHQEFLRFLNQIERDLPAGRLVHVILDNYATHKHPKVRAWLARHPRWTFHFTPTSASWLNAVEGFFAKLTRRRLQRGVFHSLVDLQATINRYLAEHNQMPKPFIWTAEPDAILAKVKRGHQALETIH